MKLRPKQFLSFPIPLRAAYALLALILTGCPEAHLPHSAASQSGATAAQAPEDQTEPDDFYKDQQQIIEDDHQNRSANKSNVQEFDSSSTATEEKGDSQENAGAANDIPTAKPSKNGIVESPFTPGQQIDVEGYPPGAVVRDPNTKKLFVVPMPATATGSPSP